MSGPVVERHYLVLAMSGYRVPEIRNLTERALVETLKLATGYTPANLSWSFLTWVEDDDEEDGGRYEGCDEAEADTAKVTAEVVVP